MDSDPRYHNPYGYDDFQQWQPSQDLFAESDEEQEDQNSDRDADGEVVPETDVEEDHELFDADSAHDVPAKAPCSKQDTVDLCESIQEIKSLLKSVCEKVEKNEKTLKELRVWQERSSTPSSSEGGTGSGSPSTYKSLKRKRVVPNEVKQEVRKTYTTLLQDKENFLGWDIGEGKTINSRQNQAVMQLMIDEVHRLNPSFGCADIRMAAYQYYRSRSQAQSAQKRGKAEALKIARRRHERLIRKKNSRESALLTNKKVTEELREKYLKVIRNDFMSSEESGSDDEIVVHSLTWRSKEVSRLFHSIDKWNLERKSPQGRRQRKNRRAGTPSQRLPPVDCPKWALSECK